MAWAFGQQGARKHRPDHQHLKANGMEASARRLTGALSATGKIPRWGLRQKKRTPS